MDTRRLVTATYVDSSALLRFILGQGDVAPVEHALATNPMSSILVTLEIRAAIFKPWHDAWISEAERDGFLAVSEQRVLPNVTLLDLTADTVSDAKAVVARHSLRTLDALHVASAVRANRFLRRRGARLEFLTADRRQSEAAQEIFGSGRVMFLPPWR